MVVREWRRDGQQCQKVDEEPDVEVHVDKKGRRYSYNSKSGVSAWLDDDKEEDKAEMDEDRISQPEALPEVSEWKSAEDPVSGKRYSYNSSGETKWD